MGQVITGTVDIPLIPCSLYDALWHHYGCSPSPSHCLFSTFLSYSGSKSTKKSPVQTIRCWQWSIDCWKQHQNVIGKDKVGGTLWAIQTSVHSTPWREHKSIRIQQSNPRKKSLETALRMRKGIPLAAGDQEAPRPTCRLGVENSLSSTKARTVTITQPHGGHSKQVATHGEENMNYHRKKNNTSTAFCLGSRRNSYKYVWHPQDSGR